jgi:hypothetical protein
VTRRDVPVAQLVLVTVGLAVALGLRPVSAREILAAYVLALAAIALIALARVARTAEEWERATSELAAALAPRKPVRVRPGELVRTERDLRLGVASAVELHARLLPKLRDTAAARLAARGAALSEAREALGPDAWELLRPDCPVPEDRTAAGVPLRRIAALVDAVERL